LDDIAFSPSSKPDDTDDGSKRRKFCIVQVHHHIVISIVMNMQMVIILEGFTITNMEKSRVQLHWIDIDSTIQ
jgi:hypothetical protein